MKLSTYTRSIGVPRSKPQLGSTGVTRRRSPRSSGLRRRQSTYARRSGRSRRRRRRERTYASLQAAIIVPSCRATSRERDRRRVTALGRRRALARRGDRVLGAERRPRRGPDRVRPRSHLRTRRRVVGTRRRLPDRRRSALARRAEDAAACSILGATASWLPFGSVDYERHGDEASVRAAIAAAADGAGALLLPGFPLTHPDHEWLGRALGGARMGCRRLGIYVEQPYARDRGPSRGPAWAVEARGDGPVFEQSRWARAIGWRSGGRFAATAHSFRSSVWTRSLRRGPLARSWASERIAWVLPEQALPQG